MSIAFLDPGNIEGEHCDVGWQMVCGISHDFAWMQVISSRESQLGTSSSK